MQALEDREKVHVEAHLGEHDVSDASVKSQSISGPLSEKLTNFSDVAPGSKKRKRDEITMDDLLKDTFIVKPYPSHPSAKPRTLQPLMLLPRSKLPLSFLDIASSAKYLSPSRLFEAQVKVLELEERMGSQPMVLIARHEDTRTLYAVERESRGLCALCQLGSWVKLQQLKDVAVASKQVLPNPQPIPLPQTTVFATAGILDTTKYSQKKRLAIEALQSMVKRPSTALPTESQISQPTSDHSETHREEIANASPIENANLQITASEIFENVRTQYFETLYLSKASLAYFAKGPLSRARAAFHLDHDSNLDLNDLITFLESIVMSTTLIDKKYRDGVPTCISLIDIEDHSADDNKQTSGKTKKRKSIKKMKPGKNGLYPTEDHLIRRWWRAHDNDGESGVPGSTKEELTKNRVSELRIRETQLQMIIILEVLALQPFASHTEVAESGLPATLPTTEVIESKEKPAKAKKPDRLTMLIDVHIDRLCIWQSVASETLSTALDDSQNAVNNGNGSGASSKHTDNVLKDFCIEVIAPFFSSRLPERCAIINRKLGGPVAVSPPKPRLSKSSSFSSSLSRPGAATKRPVPVKPRRSLQSVLTEDRERRSMSRGPNRAISLMRSATMPTVPGLKREASEAPSLSSIPAADPFQANRGGVLNSKRFSKREVDLSNFVSDLNPKAKKQAMVEAELKEAITALKKPNRQLAGKELAESAEKRTISSSHQKKSRKPTRNPLFQGVVISATPKSKRQKDFLSQPRQESGSKTTEEDTEAIPTSSYSMVPQSVSRPSHGLAPTRNPLLSSVQATPTRKPAPTFSLHKAGIQGVHDDVGGSFASSPLHVRRSSAQLFSSIPDSAAKSSQTLLSSQEIQDTPVKARLDTGHAHPQFEGGNNKENLSQEGGQKAFEGINEESIYKTLGWDDVDDLM